MRFLLPLPVAALVAASPAFADTSSAGLDGTYASIACEVRPQPNADGTMGEWWLTRRLTIADNRIEAEFTTYTGPGCDFALQRLDFAGSVETVGDSAVMDGAVDANLTIDEYVRFTPLAQPFADFLNSAECGPGGWTVGETQDVLDLGCTLLGLEPGSVTVEYEVLAVDGDHIYFGARPVDGSFITSPDVRPRALLVPAARVD